MYRFYLRKYIVSTGIFVNHMPSAASITPKHIFHSHVRVVLHKVVQCERHHVLGSAHLRPRHALHAELEGVPHLEESDCQLEIGGMPDHLVHDGERQRLLDIAVENKSWVENHGFLGF